MMQLLKMFQNEVYARKYGSSIFFAIRLSAILAVILLTLCQSTGIATAIYADADQRKLYRENIHYYDIDTCGTSVETATNPGVTPGNGDADGTLFPKLDTLAMAKAIDAFVKAHDPNSPMNKLGSTIVTSAKDADINPFLVPAIALQETSLGGAGTPQVTQAHNLFNRSATSSQPRISIATGLWYSWPSVKASVDYTNPVNKNAKGGGDFMAYMRYQYGDALDSGDLLKLFAAYDKGDEAAYIASVKTSISEMVKLAGSAKSSASTDTTSAGSSGTAPTPAGSLDKDVGASEFTDDTGYHGDDLAGTYSYAELSPPGTTTAEVSQDTANNLGGLKYKQKVAITYKDKTVVAEKLDIGLGGGNIDGKLRSIDLHFDKTAKALGVTDPNNWSGVVHVQTVADDTPLGPSTGSATTTPEAGASSSSCCPPSGGSSASATVLAGKNDEEKIWNYLITEMKFSPVQAAGVMGNMEQESGFSPTSVNPDSGAYGIAQWYAGRRTALEAYASDQGKDVSDLGVQLEFLKKELTTTYKSAVLDPLLATDDLAVATRIWLEHYEIPCNAGSGCDAEMAIRLPNAQKILSMYGGDTTSSTSSSSSTSSDCPAASSGPGEDASLMKTITVSTPGKFITLPSHYSCSGHTTVIDSRIAADIAYFVDKYKMCAEDGLASGHLSHGAGVAVDMIPSGGSAKDDWINSTEAAAKAIGWYGDSATDPVGTVHSCANYGDGDYGQCMHAVEPDKFPQWLRWLGYNGAYCHGDPWHVYGGCGAHIHIGWDTPNGDGVSSTVISEPRESVYAFPAPIPDDLKSLVD